MSCCSSTAVVEPGAVYVDHSRPRPQQFASQQSTSPTARTAALAVDVAAPAIHQATTTSPKPQSPMTDAEIAAAKLELREKTLSHHNLHRRGLSTKTRAFRKENPEKLLLPTNLEPVPTPAAILASAKLKTRPSDRRLGPRGVSSARDPGLSDSGHKLQVQLSQPKAPSIEIPSITEIATPSVTPELFPGGTLTRVGMSMDDTDLIRLQRTAAYTGSKT